MDLWSAHSSLIMQIIVQSADRSSICRWNTSSTLRKFFNLQLEYFFGFDLRIFLICRFSSYYFALQIILWFSDISSICRLNYNLQTTLQSTDSSSIWRWNSSSICTYFVDLQINYVGLQIIFWSAHNSLSCRKKFWSADDSSICR